MLPIISLRFLFFLYPIIGLSWNIFFSLGFIYNKCQCLSMISLMFGRVLLNFSTSGILGLFAVFGFELMNLPLLLLIFFFFFLKKIFSSFFHNKIHPVTNYKAIKNKINKTRQHRTKNFFNKKTTTTTTTAKQWKRRRDEITCSCPSPLLFSFWTEYQSVIWSIGCHFFNNLSLLELVNSFSISLIFLIVIFKLSKFNCLVFLAL